MVYGLWNDRGLQEAPWLLVQSTEGMYSGIFWGKQKQGSAEAVPDERKAKIALFLIPSCHE